jgi:hypothetical protein
MLLAVAGLRSMLTRRLMIVSEGCAQKAAPGNGRREDKHDG